MQRKEELISLWKEVFQDDDSFLKPFLEAREKDAEVFFKEHDGKIIAMIWFLRQKALIDKRIQEVRLISGVATKKEYRKRGIMTELLDSSSRKYDVPLILFPAVRAFYEEQGFYSSSKARVFTLAEKKHNFMDGCNIKLLDDIYRESIEKEGGLLRDEYAWKELLSSNALISIDKAYALYSFEKKLFIEAAALDKKSSESLLQLIGGRISTIPGSFFEGFLLNKDIPYEENLMGMCSENIPFYIAEQY